MGKYALESVMLIAWVILALVFAFKLKRPRIVFLANAATAALIVVITMIRHGPLIMGGVIHVLCCGFYGIVLFYLVKAVRKPSPHS